MTWVSRFSWLSIVVFKIYGEFKNFYSKEPKWSTQFYLKLEMQQNLNLKPSRDTSDKIFSSIYTYRECSIFLSSHIWSNRRRILMLCANKEKRLGINSLIKINSYFNIYLWVLIFGEFVHLYFWQLNLGQELLDSTHKSNYGHHMADLRKPNRTTSSREKHPTPASGKI